MNNTHPIHKTIDEHVDRIMRQAELNAAAAPALSTQDLELITANAVAAFRTRLHQHLRDSVKQCLDRYMGHV